MDRVLLLLKPAVQAVFPVLFAHICEYRRSSWALPTVLSQDVDYPNQIGKRIRLQLFKALY
jgi:hypothetical protein